MKKIIKRVVCVLMAVAVLPTMNITSLAFTKDGSDIDLITNTGVSIKINPKLTITSPEKNISTTATSYVICGTSNPQQKLYFNGVELTNRGIQGSFATTINLSIGQNEITVKQGNLTKTVVITRNKTTVGKTEKITSAYPTYNFAIKSSDTLNLKCVAPSGGEVWATFAGVTVKLKQNVATSQNGVPANYSGELIVPSINATVKNYGLVEYTLKYNGKTSIYRPEGNILIAGKGTNITVQNEQAALAMYADSSTNSNIVGTLRFGAVEKVIDQTTDMYKLSNGGWVHKSNVTTLEGNYSYKNKVNSTEFISTNKDESFILNGNAYPSYDATNTNTHFILKLYNTTGITKIPVSESSIFSNCKISEENGHTTLTFTKKSENSLWGYGVNYKQNQMIIYCKKPPKKSNDANKPLKNVVIALDPGHGGTDPGALGVARANGPYEKDLTLATSIATKNRLESLGATVIMLRDDDYFINLNDRMFKSIYNRVDFFVSIHYNASSNPASKGTQVFYMENESKELAQNIQTALVENTGRTNRKISAVPYRVVLNTYCPSVLCEIAFMSNPKEYDSSCTKQNLYNVANSVAEGLINSL